MVSFFGVALVDGTVLSPSGFAEGIGDVYEKVAANTDPPVAYQFILVVEGAPDPALLNCQDSNAPAACSMGTSTYSPGTLPDLQIEASHNLGDGNGNTAICDEAYGVSAVIPFDFSPAQGPTINQFACRFRNQDNLFQGRIDSRYACTEVGSSGASGFVQGNQSKIQFCGYIAEKQAFPLGDTVLAVRVRDQAGDLSQVKKIVIRVLPP